MRNLSTTLGLFYLFLAGLLFASDRGYEELGHKSDFLFKDNLNPISLRELRKYGVLICTGQDIHTIPRLSGEAFVVGFFAADGTNENLVYIWNDQGARKYLRCFSSDEQKPRYYTISLKYITPTQNNHPNSVFLQ